MLHGKDIVVPWYKVASHCVPPLSVVPSNRTLPQEARRAVCGSPARTDLCGGRSAMTVPTAIEDRREAKGGTGRHLDCDYAGAGRALSQHRRTYDAGR
jgi:hypothetical protein